MKKLILLFFLVPFGITAFAQQSKLDSLKAALSTVQDTTKVNLLLDISKAYVGTDQQQAIEYANQARNLARQHHFPKGEAYALKNIGLAYFMEGNYAEVLKYWQMSLRTFRSIQDKVGEGNLLSNIGAVYFNQGYDAKALEYYLQALQVSEAINDKFRIATAMSNIGAVYYNNPATHDKALDYYTQALKLCEKINYKMGIGASSVNIGEVYLAKGDDESALKYFQKSLKMLEESDNKDKVAYSLNNIANVYSRQKDYNQALTYHQKAFATAKSVSAKIEMAQSLIGMGNIYNLQAKTTEALQAFTQAQAIAKEVGSNNELRDAYAGLARAYAASANYQNAYQYQSLLTSVKDTLYNAETNKKIVNLQANYENEKKQAQIDLLTKDQALQKSDLQKQKVVKNALLAGLAFILLFAFVLYLNIRNKAKANNLLTLKNAEINEQKEELALQRDNLEQTYNNLVNTQEQLIQSEKMASLGQLTAGVAHEINNPINFVSSGIDSLRTNFTDMMEVLEGYLALQPEADNKQQLLKLQQLKKELEVEELMEESEQLLRSIKNGANRTKEIVKSLRNFTRLDESILKETDIHEGLDSTLVILNNLLKDRIKVVKNYGDLPSIICYPGQLNQVFMNILGNAVQAIKGEGTIAICTYAEDDYAVIKIKDNGTGMPEEVKKHIFDPFFTTKEVGEGTGLGLSISYGIIQKHKGKIEVESAPGESTEFIIRIPLVLTEAAQEKAVATV